MSDTPILPDHIQNTIETIAEARREHQRRTTPSQRVVAKLTDLVGRPRFVGGLTIVFALWIGLNGFIKLAGHAPPDPPPYSYIETITGIMGVYITLLILITQRHENRLTEAHAQLTLELAILNEQKSAKIIALLEEMRRDLPSLPDRPDAEAEQLATPADTQAVMEAIRNTTEDLADAIEGGEAEPPAVDGAAPSGP